MNHPPYTARWRCARPASCLDCISFVNRSSNSKVPANEAYPLEQRLKASHIPYEMKIHSDQGHQFTILKQLDAVRRVARFFREHFEKAA